MIELCDTILQRQGLMRNAAGELVKRIEQPPWSPPALTEQQQKEQDEYVKLHRLPF